MEAAEDQSDGFHPMCDMFCFGTSAAYSLPQKHVEGMHVNNPVDRSHTESISDWYRSLSRSKNDYQLKNCEQKVTQSDLSKNNALLNSTVAVSYHSRSYMPAFQEPLAEQQHLTSQFVSPACMQSQQTSVRTLCDLSLEQSVTTEEVMVNKCDAVKNDYHRVQHAAQYRSVLHSKGTALGNSAVQSGAGTWPLSHFGGVSYDGCSSLGNSFYNTAVIRNSCSYVRGTREDQLVKSSDLCTTLSDDESSIQPGVFSSNYKHLLDAKDNVQNLNGIAIFTDEKQQNESIVDKKCDNVDSMHRYPGWHSNVAVDHEIQPNKLEILKPLSSPNRTFGRSYTCLNSLSPSSISLSNSLNYITMHPHSSVVNIQHLEKASDCALADNEQVTENNGQNITKESVQRSKYTLSLSNAVMSDDLTQKHVSAESLLINTGSVLKDAAHVETLNCNSETFPGCTTVFEEKSVGIQSTTDAVPLSEQDCPQECYTLHGDNLASGEDVEELENQVFQTPCIIESSSRKEDLLESAENVGHQCIQKWCITGSLVTDETVHEEKEKLFVEQQYSAIRNSENASEMVMDKKTEEKMRHLQTQCINRISDETTNPEVEKDLNHVECKSLQSPCTSVQSTEEVKETEDPELKQCLQIDCTYNNNEDSDGLQKVHHQTDCIINRGTDELRNLKTGNFKRLERHCAANQSSEELDTPKEVLELEKQCFERQHICCQNSDEQDSLENKHLQAQSIIKSGTAESSNLNICQAPELLEKQHLWRCDTFEHSNEELNTQGTVDDLALESHHLRERISVRKCEKPGSLEKEHSQTWNFANRSTNESGNTEISNLEVEVQCPLKHFTFDQSSEEQSAEETDEKSELKHQHFQRYFSEGPNNLETSKADNLKTSDRIQRKSGSFESDTAETSEELEQSFWRDCIADRKGEESVSWLQGYSIVKNDKEQRILENKSEGQLENQHFQRYCTTDAKCEKFSLETVELTKRLNSQYLESCTRLHRSTENAVSVETGEVETHAHLWLTRRIEDKNSAESVCPQTNENLEGGNQFVQNLCPAIKTTQELENLNTCEELEGRLENPGIQSLCVVDRSTEEPGNLEIVEGIEGSKDQHFQRETVAEVKHETSDRLENRDKLGKRQDQDCTQRSCSADRISVDSCNVDTGERVEHPCIQRHLTVTRSSEVPDKLEHSEKQESLENLCLQINCTGYRSSEELGSLKICENIEETLENQSLQGYIDEKHDEPDRLETGDLNEDQKEQCLQEGNAVDLSSQVSVIVDTSEELGKGLQHCFHGTNGSNEPAILLNEPEQDLEEQCIQGLATLGCSKEPDFPEVDEEQKHVELSLGNCSTTVGSLVSTTFNMESVDLEVKGESFAGDVAGSKVFCCTGTSGSVSGPPEVENILSSEMKKEKKDTQPRIFERKILPARSTRGMRLEEIVQNITPSRSKASSSHIVNKVPLLRSKRLPLSRQSKQAAEEKLRSEAAIKISNDKGSKSLRSKGSLLKKSIIKDPVKPIQAKASGLKSKKSTVQEPVQESALTASSAQTVKDSLSLISCLSKSVKTEPQTTVLEVVKGSKSKNACKSQPNAAGSQHREMASKDLCQENSGSHQRASGEAGKKHNVKRIKRKREQQSSLFLPNEPEIRLKYANFKDERRDTRMDTFAPYVKVEMRDRYTCTIVNYPEEEPCLKRKKSGSLVVQNYSGVIPSSSCLTIGRISNDTKSRGELVCCLCGRSANAAGLGDLFGPFYPEGLKQEKTFVNSKSSLKVENENGGEFWSAQEKNSSQMLGGPRTRSSKNSQGSKKDKTGHINRLNSLETVVRSPPAKKMKKEPTLEEWFRPPVVPLESNEYWVHEDCAVWCTGVYIVKGKLYGLAEAAKLAQETMCSQCHKNGATLGCYYKGCSFKYHYVCAVEVGCFLNEENFSVRCSKHKDKVLKGCTLINGER
ncbi:uncharacterized protein LOC122799216 [Protopterus annectens]|uniref:uncharacterized protein LOC122799216 n=1 Tax=Protopterus annectens TaxID=7888 RepID=UPI001CFA3516|nr:uncharacterized protein LOC122799216 [Protopterus annectens]